MRAVKTTSLSSKHRTYADIDFSWRGQRRAVRERRNRMKARDNFFYISVWWNL